MLKLGVHELDLFLLGLLSGLDAMLDKPMADLLTQLPISSDVKGALLGGPTPLGKVLMLASACERVLAGSMQCVSSGHFRNSTAKSQAATAPSKA